MKNISSAPQEGLVVRPESSESVQIRKPVERPVLKNREVDTVNIRAVETDRAAQSLKLGMAEAAQRADRLGDIAQKGFSAIAQYQQDNIGSVVDSFYSQTEASVTKLADNLKAKSDKAFADLEAELSEIIPGYANYGK